MNILLVGADRTNPTDGVIVQGILNLLNKAYYNYDEKYIFLDDHNEMNLFDLYPYMTFHLIVVCGTPWLWDGFQNTVKYKNLQRIFRVHDNAKRLFMGIGTCLNLEDIKSNILKRSEELQGMKDLFTNSTVIVRDSLSKSRLKKANIESIQLPCPAYYCYNKFDITTKEKNVIIWCDPQKTISKGNWYDKEKFNTYCQIYQEFYNKENPNVYCAFRDEQESAIKIGLSEPTVLYGFKHTMDVMRTANLVLCGRVHCAIPAYSAGCSVSLTPIDTRAYTFNGNLINNKNELSNIFYQPNTGQIKEKEIEYIQILRSI